MEEVYVQECFNATSSTENLTSSQVFFMTVGFLFLSSVLPAWFTGAFLYPKPEEIEEIKEIPYEKMYDIRGCRNDGNKDNVERNILLETTPQGNICLRYSNIEEGYEYWSDKNIDYKYLETAARKYVTTFGYKDLYIDRKKDLKTKIEKLKEEIKENKENKEKNEEEQKKKEEESIFMIPKSSKVLLKTKLTKNDFVVEKANKYIRKGRFNDANWCKPKEKQEENKKTMTYKDWFFMNSSAQPCNEN